MHALSAEYLDQLSELIAQRTGLNTFGHGRKRFIETLEKHAEILYDPYGYLSRLQTFPENHQCWQALLAQLTIGETYFMRDEAQINALQNHILPTLIQAKRQTGQLSFHIWSAGCASGEEAYTLAILLYDLLPDRLHWHIDILGSDINEAALEVAREATYREWSFRTTTKRFRERFFNPIVTPPLTSPNLYAIRSEIRAMVRFTHANLVNQRYFKHPFDLILCRNVLIYFTSDQIKLLENNLGEALKMDGWLMLSPAETLQNTRSRYTVHYVDGTLVYQKKWVPVDATPPQKPRPIAKSTKKTGPLSPVMANPVKSDDYYHQAVEAVRKNDSEIASQLAQQSLMAQQYLPQTHTLLASIYASQGDSAQALTHIQQALALDMFYADAHYLTALLHIEANNLAEARNALRSAIYCRPDFALAHFLSGNLFAQQGDAVRAKRAWTTARRVATSLLPHAPLSDIAEINAEDLIQLIDNHLAGLST